MIKRRIFRRNKSISFFYIIFLIVFIFIVFLINQFYWQNQYNFFVIDENKNEFYNIPTNKKGKIISNKEIKILDYNYNLKKKTEKNYMNTEFSIQLFASSSYDTILNEFNKFANNLSFIKEELFVVVLRHNLGIDYLLVYKNFESRNEAFEFCTKYLNFIENCLIINVQELD